MNDTETYTRLLGCLRGVPERPSPDLPFRALALDSLDTVDFLCAVHAEFGVRLTEAQFHPQQTLAGLAQFLSEHTPAQPA
jgi:acyl carrier protein